MRQRVPAERPRRLEAHFNDQFQHFTRDLHELAQRIESAAKSLESIDFPSSKDLDSELQSEYERERGALEIHLNNVRTGLLALAGAVKSKQERVFESLELESLLTGGVGFRRRANPYWWPC